MRRFTLLKILLKAIGTTSCRRGRGCTPSGTGGGTVASRFPASALLSVSGLRQTVFKVTYPNVWGLRVHGLTPYASRRQLTDHGCPASSPIASPPVREIMPQSRHSPGFSRRSAVAPTDPVRRRSLRSPPLSIHRRGSEYRLAVPVGCDARRQGLWAGRHPAQRPDPALLLNWRPHRRTRGHEPHHDALIATSGRCAAGRGPHRRNRARRRGKRSAHWDSRSAPPELLDQHGDARGGHETTQG